MASSAILSEDSYSAELQKAAASDLSSVEDLGIVTVYKTDDDSHRLLHDGDGNGVVVLVPGNVPGEKDAWEKSFHLFLRETAELVKSDYRIVYVHSGFASPLWFITWWLLRLRSRVSRNHRKNLKALSILHPTFAVRLFFLSVRPFISAKFWEKLHYCDRVDELFLDNVIPKEHINRILPASVLANEEKIVEDGEIARQMAIASGAQLNPRT